MYVMVFYNYSNDRRVAVESITGVIQYEFIYLHPSKCPYEPVAEPVAFSSFSNPIQHYFSQESANV